jgi:hypothetical protein
MFRCLRCGCSRTDAGGFLSCILCGTACGLRTEAVLLTDDTKAILLAHTEDLKAFGLTLEKCEPLQKDVRTIATVVNVVLNIATSLDAGVLKKLIHSLHQWGIDRNELQGLRLTEPEEVDEICNESTGVPCVADAKYLFTVKLKYQDDLEKITGTRAEEPHGAGTLVIYDGDAIVARYADKVERWSRQADFP